MSKFKLNDRVRIVRTGGDILENATGTVLGPTLEISGPDGFFIVLLDVPLADRAAVVFTEHCLEAAPNTYRPEDLEPTHWPC